MDIDESFYLFKYLSSEVEYQGGRGGMALCYLKQN